MKRKQQSLLRSFACALQGMLTVIALERTFKIQLLVACAAIILSIVLSLTAFEWCLIILIIAIVLAAEMFNSAIEKTIDIVINCYDERARKAKDAAAGAVLLLSIAAAISGSIIFLQALLRLVGANND